MPRSFSRNYGSRLGTRSGVVTLNSDWDEVVIGEVIDWMEDELVPDVWAEMERDVPVDTGELASKMFARVRKLGKRVATLEAGSTAKHFQFVEYGTGTRGNQSWDASVEGPFPLPAGYVHGSVPGNRAQPFARPAIWTVMKRHMAVGRS